MLPWACYSPAGTNGKIPFFYYPRLRFEHGRHGGKHGFDPSTFEHMYPVRSDVYSHLPFTLTVKKKKNKNKNNKKKTERKSSQTNLSKNKRKGRIIGYTRHDTNFCSGTSARSQCVHSLWSKETSRSMGSLRIDDFRTTPPPLGHVIVLRCRLLEI